MHNYPQNAAWSGKKILCVILRITQNNETHSASSGMGFIIFLERSVLFLIISSDTLLLLPALRFFPHSVKQPLQDWERNAVVHPQPLSVGWAHQGNQITLFVSGK